MQQQNTVTNFLLGIIAIALVLIVIFLFVQKKPVVQMQNQDMYGQRPEVPLNNQNTGTMQNTTGTQANSPIVSVNSSQSQTYPITAIATNSDDPHIAGAIPGSNEPANFNGHYNVVFIGCGSGCANPALYDRTSRTMYNFPAAMLSGALADNGAMADIPWMSYDVASPAISLKKKNSAGALYIEQWKMVGSGFVKQ